MTVTTRLGFGLGDMVSPLRRVALRHPDEATFSADPEEWGYAAPVQRSKMAQQHQAFADLVAGSGAAVEWVPGDSGFNVADAIFPFDPSIMTPRGPLLLRPGKVARRPETRLHHDLYQRLGVPVAGRIVEPGTVEGGDVVWLDRRTVLVGRGYRTNQEGIDQLEQLLAPMGVEVFAYDLPHWLGPKACLHLLSLLSPLDHDLILCHAPLLPASLLQFLESRGVECVVADPEEFRASAGLSVNVLALGPRQILAIDGFPKTHRTLIAAGCDVVTFAADALCLPCEGGPTCLSLPIEREKTTSNRSSGGNP